MDEYFGARLRRLRIWKGLTQLDLSRICGWKGNQTISGLERLARPPSHETLVKLAHGLGVTVEALRGETCLPRVLQADTEPSRLQLVPMQDRRRA